jgi:uncharacterized protein YoaH (UPF0181 family)
MATIIDINETKQPHAPRFTEEQKEAWQKAKALLKSGMTNTRALHIAMSELRKENGRKHKGPIETEPKRDGKLTEYKAKLVSSQMAARVAQWKAYLRDPGSQKLFIIVRNDLETSQKAVQASHAAAEFSKRHPLAPWVNGTMVLLIPDQTSQTFQRYLEAPHRPVSPTYQHDPFEAFCHDRFWPFEFQTEWREPDQGNRITAVAVLSCFNNELCSKQHGVKLL